MDNMKIVYFVFYDDDIKLKWNEWKSPATKNS